MDFGIRDLDLPDPEGNTKRDNSCLSIGSFKYSCEKITYRFSEYNICFAFEINIS